MFQQKLLHSQRMGMGYLYLPNPPLPDLTAQVRKVWVEANSSIAPYREAMSLPFQHAPLIQFELSRELRISFINLNPQDTH